MTRLLWRRVHCQRLLHRLLYLEVATSCCYLRFGITIILRLTKRFECFFNLTLPPAAKSDRNTAHLEILRVPSKMLRYHGIAAHLNRRILIPCRSDRHSAYGETCNKKRRLLDDCLCSFQSFRSYCQHSF